MIEIIKKGPGFAGSENLKYDLINKKIHIVAAAQNGLTHLNLYAELFCGLEKDLVNQCVDLVNKNKETGTLFPAAHISIIPKSSNPRYWSANEIVLTKKELELCIEDVFKANQNYLKNESIFFSIEPSYMQTELIYTILDEMVNQDKINDPHLKRILVV